MISFLEYSYNLDQVSDIFNRLASSRTIQPDDLMKELLMSVPVAYMDKLPDLARHDAAMVLRKILLYRNRSWDKLKGYVEPLWDQPISGPAKTLGKDLLNWISAQVMEDNKSEFFISYSGEMSKGTVFAYTKQKIRVFLSKRDYGWKPYKELYAAIMAEYTEKVYNYTKQLGKLG